MPQTTRGYPYPLGGVAPDVPYDMQQLAEAIDLDVTETTTALSALIGGKRVLAGSSVSTGTAAGDRNISWGAGVFATAPVVIACPGDTTSSPATVVVLQSTLGTTGVNVRVTNAAGAAITGACRVNWIAVGTPYSTTK
ncbi:hypothetical protein [Cellulomonas sp. NPDC089187]|uniref:hypothetical protein n=1 Tax=Cellulomonas sp. NPDC089187 TaxID=3154970 RepID=UPI00342D74B0